MVQDGRVMEHHVTTIVVCVCTVNYIYRCTMGYSIDLDCAPGRPRPGDLLPGALHGTPIKASDLGEPVSKFFGNWMWVIPTKLEKVYAKHQKRVQANITDLYNEGAIRYGSW